ncbi:MAG TPA: hypothetical protein VGX76_22985 [Pirellulales bacterium]|nr:hypothetical protein [Pirellulales bacterium]
MVPQLHGAIARAIALRSNSGGGLRSDSGGGLRIDEDDDDDEDADDDEDDDDDDSIGELREQVELLRREVHELGALVRQVVREK